MEHRSLQKGIWINGIETNIVKEKWLKMQTIYNVGYLG